MLSPFSSLEQAGKTMHASAGAAQYRVTVRLLSYWERLRAARDMPSTPEIKPDEIQDLWDYCFLIQPCDPKNADYDYSYLGAAIIRAYNGTLSPDDPGGLISPAANKLAPSYARVLETKQPLLEEGEFRNLRNDIVKYRQCLLPLGVDGVVDSIFGGMRFRIFPARES